MLWNIIYKSKRNVFLSIPIYLFLFKVTSSKELTVTKTLVDDNSRQVFQIAASTPVNSHSHDINATVKFFSPLTKTTQTVEVVIRGAGDGTRCGRFMPSLTTTSTKSNTLSDDFTVRGLIYRLVGDSGLLIIFYSFVIATVILILILYHFYVKPKQQTPMVIHSPYIQTPYANAHSHSPPPYQASPLYQNSPHHISPYRANKDTPTRLFSVSQ